MKRQIKSGLEKTIEMFLEDIENGREIIVNKMEAGTLLLPIPYQVFDCEPHVCDFKKAGVPNEEIAFYFAYLLTGEPLHDVLDADGKPYKRCELPKISDCLRYKKFEKHVMPKVWEERNARIERKQQSKKESCEETL